MTLRKKSTKGRASGSPKHAQQHVPKHGQSHVPSVNHHRQTHSPSNAEIAVQNARIEAQLAVITEHLAALSRGTLSSGTLSSGTHGTGSHEKHGVKNTSKQTSPSYAASGKTPAASTAPVQKVSPTHVQKVSPTHAQKVSTTHVQPVRPVQKVSAASRKAERIALLENEMALHEESYKSQMSAQKESHYANMTAQKESYNAKAASQRELYNSQRAAFREELAALRQASNDDRASRSRRSHSSSPNAEIISSLQAQIAAINAQAAKLADQLASLQHVDDVDVPDYYRPDDFDMSNDHRSYDSEYADDFDTLNDFDMSDDHRSYDSEYADANDFHRYVNAAVNPATLSPIPYTPAPSSNARSQRPGKRMMLPAPVLGKVFAIGPHSIMVNWSPVPGATSYRVRLSPDPDLTTANQWVTLPADVTAVILIGREPGSTCWVGVRADAAAPDTNSGYSATVEVTTPQAEEPGVIGDLRSWLNVMEEMNKQFFTLLPEFSNVTLTPGERRRSLGAGVRRYGFIDQVSDTALQYPQFWPASYADHGKLKELIRQIEVLRNLSIFFEKGARKTVDMMLAAGNAAFRLSNMYYRSVREASHEQFDGAEAVFNLLRQFWHRRKQVIGAPTERQAMRDARAVAQGRRVGTVSFTNTADRVAKGQRGYRDETWPTRSHDGGRATKYDDYGDYGYGTGNSNGNGNYDDDDDLDWEGIE